MFWIIGTGIGMFIISIFLSKVIYGKFEEKLCRFTAIFSNCGYMGLPLCMLFLEVKAYFYGYSILLPFIPFFGAMVI